MLPTFTHPHNACLGSWLKALHPAGKAEPLGPSLADGGVNFAVAAPNASKMTLVLFNASGKELQQFPLTADQHRCLLPHVPLSCLLNLSYLPEAKAVYEP